MNIHNKLLSWMSISHDDDSILDYLETELIKSQSLNQNADSNRIYLEKRILTAHLRYLDVISFLKENSFYEAWVELERIEIDLMVIKDNKDFIPEISHYGINFLARMVRNWQNLFPYKIFGSSRELIKEVRCSVCNQTRSFIDDCGHVKNKIYNGNLCYDEVVDFEIITYDVVSNPVNKFSVFFASDGDHNNYSHLISVIKYIESPHQIFQVLTWKYKTQEHTGVISPESMCPCGNFKKYANCCLKYDFICGKHIHIWFPLPLNVEPV